MITRTLLMTCAGLLMSATMAAQAPPPLKIGTRVGMPEKSGYDGGGRRDPFVSLIVERAPVVATSGESMEARAKGLAGIDVVDVAVRGIITSGDQWLAIIAGPNGAQYLAHTDDRLHDGSVRRIDRDAVIFLARVPDGTGKLVSREVRKGIRAGTGSGR